MKEKDSINFEEISRLTDEGEQVDQLYALFGEEKRLNASNASRAEFLSTVRYIERYLRLGDRILDIGAGAYSFYFAWKGYSVSALEVAAANAQKFRESMREGDQST